MTNLPADLREQLAARFAAARPELVAHTVADGGHTHKLLLALRRRRGHRDRPDAVPEPGDGLHLDPGRLRHGLPVLRHRAGRAYAAS